MSLASYQRVRAAAETPRATEYRLVGEITGEMLDAWEKGARGPALMPALHRNREMWSTFSAVCGAQGNALPDKLRASIISIALWVDRFTSDVVAGREPIDPLIDVNRSVLEGLAQTRAAA
jgi:flagellar biosynthesis activator protein FlaF